LNKLFEAFDLNKSGNVSPGELIRIGKVNLISLSSTQLTILLLPGWCRFDRKSHQERVDCREGISPPLGDGHKQVTIRGGD